MIAFDFTGRIVLGAVAALVAGAAASRFRNLEHPTILAS
jgi:hypothetical protein